MAIRLAVGTAHSPQATRRYKPMDVLPAQASSIPCERLFSSRKEPCTPRRNRIQPNLMEALQALKFSSRNGLLDLTEHVSPGFDPLEDEMDLCEALEVTFLYR